MLLCLLFGGMCVFFTFTVSLIVLCITVPGIFFNLPTILGYVIDFIVMMVQFYSEITFFLIGICVELLSCMFSLINGLIDLMTNEQRPLQNEILQAGRDVWNFVLHAAYCLRQRFLSGDHPQWLVAIWGFVITSVYFYFNMVHNLFTSVHLDRNIEQDEANNAAENNNEMNNNFQNRNINPGPALADGAREPPNEELGSVRQRIVNANVANRVTHRLYPDLSDLQHDEVVVNNVQVPSAPELQDGRLCCVCLEHERNIALFPCGHTYLCQICTADIMASNRRCPICQGGITEFRHVYL